VLSVPQGGVKEAGGRQYITVLLPDGTREERTVTLGSISSFGEVEILSGAVAGDTILLTP
jgi:hypothetical protein